jgi:hypothetical protein
MEYTGIGRNGKPLDKQNPGVVKLESIEGGCILFDKFTLSLIGWLTATHHLEDAIV